MIMYAVLTAEAVPPASIAEIVAFSCASVETV
jgi:hypothetical protein